MAVFMSPRTNYELGRYAPHSWMSWFVTWCMLIGLVFVGIGYTAEGEAKKYLPGSIALSVLAGGTLVSKKGRKTLTRVAGETFYGTLHSFTGVCSSNYNDEVGSGGGSAREM